MSTKKGENSMDNGKVQPNQKPSRKGRIQMGIHRTLSTERFQTIVIHYEIDEEIEWQTLTERENKVMNWQTVLTREFKDIHDRVLEELKLIHKKAYFKDMTEKNQAESYDMGSITNLDELDALAG
jgi:hypothetical protein